MTSVPEWICDYGACNVSCLGRRSVDDLYISMFRLSFNYRVPNMIIALSMFELSCNNSVPYMIIACT